MISITGSDSVGGGGSSRNFPGITVSGAGGGGSSTHFWTSPVTICQPDYVGGGRICWVIS